MSKSTVLQLVAAIILILGGILFYQYFTNTEETSSLLPGIGAVAMGFALLAVSKNKRVTGGE